MTVAELIEQLQAFPMDAKVEVNDNNGGEVYEIEHIDHFEKDEYDPEVVVFQVNT